MSSSSSNTVADNPVFNRILSLRNDTRALSALLVPGWVDDVGFRGTASILVSCVGTLVACIYSALHLNMMHPLLLRAGGPWAAARAKLKWVAIALVAPDLVLYVAARQYLDARRLVRKLNEIVGRNHGDRFELEYAFFVLMGGIQVDVSNFLAENFSSYLPHRHRAAVERGIGGGDGDGNGNDEYHPTTLALTPQGLVQLARHYRYLRVPLSRIQDKSNSDFVKKSLVICQLSWMIAQCVTRAVIGLPLCLLEIHTAAHAFCALLLYVVWMKKPQDVNDPELVKTDTLDHFMAYMIQEQLFALQNPNLIIYPPWTNGSANSWPKVLSAGWSEPDNLTYEVDEKGETASVEWVDDVWGDIDLYPGQALKCGVGLIRREPDDPSSSSSSSSPSQSDSSPSSKFPMTITFQDQERFRALVRFLEMLHHDGRPCWTPYLYHPHARPGGSSPRLARCHYHQAFALPGADSNLPYVVADDDDGNDGDGGGSSGLGGSLWDMVSHVQRRPLLLGLLLLLPLVYGGVHLAAAWDFRFATGAERLGWRVAGAVIAGAFPALVGALTICRWSERGIMGARSGGPVFFAAVRRLVWYLVLAVYGLARLYVVVEAFAGLRRLPIGVFWMPDWLEMLPHL
ncbi:hypothetical protein F4778DRAFT_780156 [Xylariomycetidae sp. FL2044]|nr:hypothetical protein F4778DRAFT_780156 [Xylariomycetidae sp. FL2044]